MSGGDDVDWHRNRVLARHSKPALPIVPREKQQSNHSKHCVPSTASRVELLTSTSNENLSPIFCIQIEQCSAGQKTAVQSKGTCTTDQTFHSGSVRHVNSSLLQRWSILEQQCCVQMHEVRHTRTHSGHKACEQHQVANRLDCTPPRMHTGNGRKFMHVHMF